MVGEKIFFSLIDCVRIEPLHAGCLVLEGRYFTGRTMVFAPFKEGVRGSVAGEAAGVEDVADSVAEEVDAEDCEHDGQAGENGEVGGEEEVAGALV